MSFPFTDAFRQTIGAACRGFPRLAHEGAELRRAAVALALVAADDGSGETAFLLTRRAPSLRAHAGQWALPGGRCDPGETAAETAARELEEELGVRLPAEHVLGTLDDFATRSGYVITPVVAWLEASDVLTPNPAEVASAHRVRLDQIAREEAVAFIAGDDDPQPLLRIYIGEQFIHAPTAAMVYQLRELVAGRITRVAHLEQPAFAWR
ncbi:MAG TPA: CoA pyrophosphatase [Caulobacteraceae bacterium]|jgi:8-oxo-dGTP pyrophosphatase MutT (NUDIX family)